MKGIIKYCFVAVVGMFLLTACNGKRQPDPSMDSSPMMTGFPASSNNSLDATRDLDDQIQPWDYYGTYEGVIPAADADGIRTTLVLFDDNTYNLTRVYEGKGAGDAFEQHGKYNVTGDMLTLQSDGQEEYYKLDNGSLLQLDTNKQVITGNLADNYRLKKK